LSHISIGRALRFSLSFLVRNYAAIAVRIALPALAGWIALYISLSMYLAELGRYLDNPSDRVASLVLGLATAGLLVMLFMHSVIVASISALALGYRDGRWKYFQIERCEWRLYAANLRLLLVLGVWIVAMRVLEIAAIRFLSTVNFDLVLDAIMGAAGAFLVVRVWFLMAPTAVTNTHGKILRRAWQQSAGNFWRVAAIIFVLLLVGLAVETAGEFVLRASVEFPPIPGNGSLADYTAMYRKVLPEVLCVVGIAYLLCNVMMTAARLDVYRQLTENTES